MERSRLYTIKTDNKSDSCGMLKPWYWMLIVLVVTILFPGLTTAKPEGSFSLVDWIEEDVELSFEEWASSHYNQCASEFEYMIEQLYQARLGDEKNKVDRINDLAKRLVVLTIDEDVQEGLRHRWIRYRKTTTDDMRLWLQCRKALKAIYSFEESSQTQAGKAIDKILLDHPHYHYAKVVRAHLSAFRLFHELKVSDGLVRQLQTDLDRCEVFRGELAVDAILVWGRFILNRMVSKAESYQPLAFEMQSIVELSGQPEDSLVQQRLELPVYSYYLAVMSHASQRPLREVLQQLQHSVQWMPDNPTVLLLQGHLLEELGSVEQGHDIFRKLSILQPDWPEGWYYAARCQLDAGKTADVATYLSQIPLDSYLAKGDSLRFLQARLAYLNSDLKKGDTLAKTLLLEPDSAAGFYLNALRARSNNDWTATLQAFRNAYQTAQQEHIEFTDEVFIPHSSFQLLRAHAELAMGQASNALPLLHDYIELNPLTITGYAMLGEAQFLVGRSDMAQTSFSLALQRDPDLTRVWRLLGDVYVSEKQNELAQECYENAGKNGDTADLAAGRMRLALAKKDNDSAVQQAEMALALDPGYLECAYWLGVFAGEREDEDLAVQYLTAVYENAPVNSAMRRHALYLIREYQPAFGIDAKQQGKTMPLWYYGLLAITSIAGLWIFWKSSPRKRKAKPHAEQS